MLRGSQETNKSHPKRTCAKKCPKLSPEKDSESTSLDWWRMYRNHKAAIIFFATASVVFVEAPQVPDGPTDEELAKAAAIKKAGKMGRWQGRWQGGWQWC